MRTATACSRLLPLLLLAACSSTPAAEPVRASPEVGSLRNARVALARGPGAPELTYFAPAMGAEELAELARSAPRVRIVAGLSRQEALARAAEAHGADAAYASPEFLRAAVNLAWLQAPSAGVERWVGLEELRSSERIVFTNQRGVHGPAIADHAFAMLLTLTRDLPVHLAGRARGTWLREGSGELEPVALDGKTLLVVGLGGIGTEIARRGHGFGLRVLATRRGDEPGPEFVERVAKPSELLALLPEADVVALAVPLTPETEGLIDARALAAMKPGAYLVNVARGRVVDQEALVEALRSGKLAGACLDVTEPEPLPPQHPLWSFPNVVITPHVAARAEITGERRRALFRENLRRFDAGEPLLNVVDIGAGY
ncbi:MAG: D-2-hydroxyacid dehydrogenase [Planctomycetes bacterium]|nr:D-2-hydroxyacid dehydrogenase [Planctomycetota bacterium]